MRVIVTSLISVVFVSAASAQSPPAPKPDPNVLTLPAGTFEPGKVPTLPPGGHTAPTGPIEIGAGDTRLQLPPKYGTYGPRGASRPACGGVENGKLQNPCPTQAGMFVDDAVYVCPKGSVADLLSMSCWSCPEGFRRSGQTVDGEKACRQRDEAESGGYAPAKFVAATCPKGSFWVRQRGGECWSCPEGFHRGMAPIRSDRACVKPARDQGAPAIRKREATLENPQCEAGEFFDPVAGDCWSCPPGHERAEVDLTSPVACVRGEPRERAPAKLEGQRKCGEGEHLEGRNGGECWSCPRLYDRTALPVTGQKACHKADNVAYSEAQFVTSLHCGPDEVFDPANGKSDKVSEAIRAQGGTAPPDLGKGGGGTCWRCPIAYKRTVYPVWSDKACEGIGVDWSPAPYEQPGLFGLDGGEVVAREVIVKRPQLINDLAAALAPELGETADAAQREAWEEIRDEPENSIVLKMAVFSRVQAAAADPSTATEAERKLVASFALAIQRYREFLAENTLGVARAWRDVDDHIRAERVKGAGQTGGWIASDPSELLGREPPDFEAISATTIAATFAGTAAVLAAGIAIASAKSVNIGTVLRPGNRSAQKISYSYKRLPYQRSNSVVIHERNLMGNIRFRWKRVLGTRAESMIGKKAFKFGSKIGSKIASNCLNVGTAGFSLVIEIAVELIVNSIVMVVERANMIPKLEAALAQARQPVDLARLADTFEGYKAMVGYWGNSMSGDLRPSDPASFAATAKIEIQKLPPAAK